MIILGTNSIKDTGYDVANSYRSNSGDSPKLSKTFSSASNSNTTFTVSAWVKRSKLGANQDVVSAFQSSSGKQTDLIRFGSGDDLEFYAHTTNSSGNADIQTNRLFRDVGAWYHIVVRVDTTQGTDTNRVRIYVNGVQETSFSTSNYMSQNGTIIWGLGSGTEHTIGAVGTSNYFGGYVAEVVYLDSQSVAPTTFGEFDEDSGIWKPIDVSGLTFGNNSFYLDFENSAELGTDASGNSHTFTENNIVATDQSIDTCTNNFGTLNPLNSWGGAVLSEGNLKLASTATAFDHTSATIHMNSGKWYMEFNQVATSGGSAVACFLAGTGEFQNDQTSWISSGDGAFGIGMNGFKITDGVEEGSPSFSAVSSGDIVQIAYDSDTGKAWFGINNSWLASGNPSTNANPYFTSSKLQNNDVSLKLITYTSNNTSIANFGQDSSFAGTKTKQSNQDSNSQGNFFYSPPTDFLALNTKNLAEYG